MFGLKRHSEENTVRIGVYLFISLSFKLQESANKVNKKVRELRTRKDDPVHCLKDMLVHARVRFFHIFTVLFLLTGLYCTTCPTLVSHSIYFSV